MRPPSWRDQAKRTSRRCPVTVPSRVARQGGCCSMQCCWFNGQVRTDGWLLLLMCVSDLFVPNQYSMRAGKVLVGVGEAKLFHPAEERKQGEGEGYVWILMHRAKST